MTLSIFNSEFKKDVFGYYLCDNLKFYSKIEAIEFSKRVNKSIEWKFNDEVFSLFDWTKEPENSIQELYRKRAQQLRNNYDYLILFYSSGIDSDNILTSFIENDIKLDEVVSMVNYEGSNDMLSKMNAEITQLAIPKIKECQIKQPHLIHTIYDITKKFIEQYSTLDLNLIYKQNNLFTTLHSSIDNVRKEISQKNKQINSGKKVALIYGIDKPKVEIDEFGNFNFKFGENAVHGMINANTSIENNPWEFNELFYWSPDFPLIPIKQAHIIKNYFKRNGIEKFEKSPVKRGTFNLQSPDGSFTLLYSESVEKKYWLRNKELNRLIYPHWVEKPYQYKTISCFFYDKDDWFHKLPNNEEIKKNWWKILQKVSEITETSPIRDSNFSKLMPCKLYNLGN